jgi:hypothetical protein
LETVTWLVRLGWRHDSVSLRMRKMNHSHESAVCKLLPGW